MVLFFSTVTTKGTVDAVVTEDVTLNIKKS